MDRNVINAKFKELAQYRMMEAEAKALKEELENELKAMMEEEGIDTLIGDEHKVTWKEEIKRTFDSKAFKAAGYEELYESFRKPSKSRPFKFA